MPSFEDNSKSVAVPPDGRPTYTQEELEEILGIEVVPSKTVRAFDKARSLVPTILFERQPGDYFGAAGLKTFIPSHMTTTFSQVRTTEIRSGGKTVTYSGDPGLTTKDFDERISTFGVMPFVRLSRGPLAYDYYDYREASDHKLAHSKSASELPLNPRSEYPKRSASTSPTGLRIEMGCHQRDGSMEWAKWNNPRMDIRHMTKVGLNIDTDFQNVESMPLTVDLYDLGLENPKTKEQTSSVLGIIGDEVRNLVSGETVSFERIQSRILAETDLQKRKGHSDLDQKFLDMNYLPGGLNDRARGIERSHVLRTLET